MSKNAKKCQKNAKKNANIKYIYIYIVHARYGKIYSKINEIYNINKQI